MIAPDKFKGTLTAAQAATAMAEGWSRVRPHDDIVLTPMADGGTGTVAVVASTVGGSRVIEMEVADPLGRPRTAAWLRLPDGRAVVETAQAIGLDLLSETERDPLGSTSYGAGQLIAAAAAAGCAEIVVGLGGSATVDAGAGAAVAMGCRLLNADGNAIELGAVALADASYVVHPGPPVARVVAAVDVMNSLLGPEGAQLYAPQKGAGPRDVEVLERALEHFADIVERDVVGGAMRDRPGAGAAGGLGFALMAFTGATVRSGAETVAELVGFDEAVHEADVVLTGEGALDAQTRWGKAPGYVAQRARGVGATVFAIAGAVEEPAARGFDRVLALGPEGLERPVQLIFASASELALSIDRA